MPFHLPAPLLKWFSGLKCIKGSIYLITPGHLDHSDQPRQIPSEGFEGMFSNPELPGDKGEKGGGESKVLFAQFVTGWPTSQRMKCRPQTTSPLPGPQTRALLMVSEMTDSGFFLGGSGLSPNLRVAQLRAGRDHLLAAGRRAQLCARDLTGATGPNTQKWPW